MRSERAVSPTDRTRPGIHRDGVALSSLGCGWLIMTVIGTDFPAHTRDSRVVQDLLLAAGVLSSGLYVSADVVCGLRYPGYSFRDQVISELSAIGAPTTELWVTLLTAYPVLLAAFTIGVLREGRGNRRLCLTRWLLLAFLLSGPLWSFFPMHQRGEAFAWTDAGHIALGAVMVPLLSAVVASGAGALGKRFRRFSLVMLSVAVTAGIGTFLYVPRMIAQLPTPWVGVVERVFLYAVLLWIAVLAVGLVVTPRTHFTGDS